MATADEIVVKLVAQTDQLKAGMAEASAAVQTSSDTMAASFSSATASFAAFDAIQKANLGTAAEVAAAQRTINEVQATGAFTSEELAAKQALVDAAMLKVGKDTQAASGFLSLFTRNSRTMYSTSALITDAMTGQFSRMRREVAALGNETGLMAKAFTLIASPVGVASLAAVGLGVAFVEAADRFEQFQQAVLSTGNIIGMTAAELQTMSDDIGTLTGSSFDAVEAVNAIGRSGLFTGEQLRTASEAAVYFSQVTGENMSKAANVIEQLQDKPKEAIVKLNDQYHFLNETQAELIVRLLNTGQNAQAAAVAVQAFHDAMADRAQQMLDNTTALARDWHAVKEWTEQSVEKLAEYLNMLGGSKDVTDQLNRAYIQLANDQSGLFKLAHPFTSQADAIKQDMAVIDALRDKESQQEAQARKTAAANKAAAETLDKGVGKGHEGSGIGALEQQFQQQEAAAHASYEQMKQDAADFWNEQATNANNSAQVQAQAWQKYILARHQLDEEGLAEDNAATRKREENARKTAEAAKESARLQQRVHEQASQSLRDEIKKEAAAQDAANLAKIRGVRSVALAQIATRQEEAQEEYSEGNITAKQLLQIQQDLVKQELATVIAYYKEKEKLDKGDVAEVTRDATAISLATQKARQQDAKDEKKFHQNSLKEWRQYSQRVAGMVASQTSAILFQHQSLKGAMTNILESMVTDWVAGEARKLAATIGFGAQETAAKETQRAANTAADIADKSAAAIRAAGLAGAQGIASFAAAPWPVDIGAPAFGAAMFAAAASFGSIASAAGGWDRVPADGVHTELHRDEMVLPKHVADPVRKMAKSGATGGGATHFHFQSFAPRDFAAYLKRNPAALRAALGHAGRNGWTS